jgi:uncharacterized membrane protein YraQ (UPF0718 family)
MFSVMLAGATQRMVEVAFQAAPTILVGIVVAGVIRYLVGYDQLRRWLGGGLLASLFKGWVVGMLLPVCSLGVLPVIREFQKAGVRGGTTLAFGLTAPLFNPISVLYGLTLSDPFTLFVFCMGSLIVVSLLGVLWDRLFPPNKEREESPIAIPHGIRRITAIGTASARESVGPILIYSAVGLLGVGILAAALPHGRLQMAAEANDPFAPLFMATMAIPAYAAPMTVMMQLASMFQHGNSIGAAFTLLVLGAGLNVGLLLWMMLNHSTVKTLAAIGSLFVLVVAIGYGLDKPLYPTGIEPAGHTHAFDGYCNPFFPGETEPWARMMKNIPENVQAHEWVAGVVLLVTILVGCIFQVFDSQCRVEKWLAFEQAKAKGNQKWDIELPGSVLGVVAFVGLVAASIFGCFLYYPPREEIFKEMRFVHTEVFSSANSGQFEATLRWIPIYEDWNRKLIVSEYLRGRPVSRYQRMKSRVLANRLELLEHEAEDQELEICQEMVIPLNRSFERLKKAFRPEEQP